MRTWARIAIVLAIVLVAGSCTSAALPEKGTIVIATSFPLSGADRVKGGPAKAGVAYAIAKTPVVKGFVIQQHDYDDAVNGTSDAQKAVEDYTSMCDDPSILAVVGPLDSTVARSIIPVTASCGLVTVSPANTEACLTKDAGGCDPSPTALRGGKPNTYFRISVPDPTQGLALAVFARETLKVTKAAIWSDGEPSGNAAAEAFRQGFERGGGTVVLEQELDWRNTDTFKSFLERAREAGAGAIFAGAASSTNACLARAAGKGIIDPKKVSYLGPEAIGDSHCIVQAGDQAENMYFGTSATDPTEDPRNKALVADFQKTMTGKDDYGTYTFASYDCAAILLDAIGRAIDAAAGKMPTRKQILDAIQSTTELDLTTGTYAFRQTGDPTAATMSIYGVRNATWVFDTRVVVRDR